MAIDSYVVFIPYKGSALSSESMVDMSKSNEPLAADMKQYATGTTAQGQSTAGKIFEIEDYSFDIEQTLNIGSQSSGAGAGKVTFNPFSITRKIDCASPILFNMACSGTAFQQVILALRKSAGAGAGSFSSGVIFLRFDFRLVAVKTISWSHDDESPKETVTFEYGAMVIRYCQQNSDGSLQGAVSGGWNRVMNKQDTTLTPL
jgi:type VI protein secretion system component Hcp